MMTTQETLIPLSVIESFTSECESRWMLTKPRVIGDLLVATDGRILIEVPRQEVEPGEIEVLEGVYPAYEQVIDPEFEAPLVPITMPPLPAKVVKWKKCWDCRGKGYYPSGVECVECDGEGGWDDLEDYAVEAVPGVWCAGIYVEKALALPNLRWYAPSVSPGDPHRTRALRFHFGRAGRGVLMPYHKAPEAEKASAAPGPIAHLEKVLRREATDMLEERAAPEPHFVVGLITVLGNFVRVSDAAAIHKAFGSPGDWGYETDLGAALAKVYGLRCGEGGEG